MSLVLPSLLWTLLGAAPTASDPLCAGRAPCQVVETLHGGKDARGQPLRVVRLDLGWFSSDDAPEEKGRKFGAGRRAKGSLVEDDCAASEWWLVSPDTSQLLLAVCNDGYGSAQKGEDVVKVKNGLFSHVQSGGDSQRWLHTRVWRLSPLERVREGHVNFLMGQDDVEDRTAWDFSTLQGSRFLGPETCQDGPFAPNKRTLPYLPRVPLDAAYVDEGWKRVGLGTCALQAKNVTLGKLKGARDASLKALLVAPGTLILEVRDNLWVGTGGKTWREEDHLELWLGAKSPEALTGCGKPEADERLVQWGISITTGLVFPGYGPPRGELGVERVELRGKSGELEGYRLKLTLPGRFAGIGIAYNDSDESGKPERTLATSPLKFSRPETLNIVRDVPRAEGTCVVRGQALEVVVAPPRLQGLEVAVLPSGPSPSVAHGR
ncbi:hypothetical protein D187_003749 [Cystobacter fuscus DSM 2262]|uniref:Uncharacterized protein n=1 Tax=Cystobacter fuscus (strain ATCC 25194 / DSM 2262 / NBRC 100088 / M29) TaxID=1242864 RepID=S9P5T7_CYSF2|nr:hypothetical protein [Cystobacter fuscus]EPX58551.1 hypothetical protein D187_003749 [Cystobacter fuscus DSM 2262]